MGGSFSLTKAQLLLLIDPRFNLPRPLPLEVFGPRPEPWIIAGPQPQPWREVMGQGVPWKVRWGSVMLGRGVLEQAFNQVRYAWRESGGGESEQALESARSYLREVVDDFCGSEGPRWPIHIPLPPWPWPDPWPGPRPDEFKLDPMDLLVIGAQFQRAADVLTRNPLRAELEEGADRLLEEGVRQLKG